MGLLQEMFLILKEVISNHKVEIIMLVTLLPLSLSAYYHSRTASAAARAARVAERDLQRQVTDITTIVERLKQQEKARSDLEKAQAEANINQISDYAELKGYTSFCFEHFNFVTSSHSRSFRVRVFLLAASVSCLARHLHTANDAKTSAIVEACDALKHLVVVELREEEEKREPIAEREAAFRQAIDALKQGDTPEARGRIHEELGRMRETYARLNDKLAESLSEPQERYYAAIDRLTEMLQFRPYQ